MHTLILAVLLSTPTHHTEYQTIGLIGRGAEGNLIFGNIYVSREQCESHATDTARSWFATMQGTPFPFLVACRNVAVFGPKQRPHR